LKAAKFALYKGRVGVLRRAREVTTSPAAVAAHEAVPKKYFLQTNTNQMAGMGKLIDGQAPTAQVLAS
jgi:hypothetical protein